MVSELHHKHGGLNYSGGSLSRQSTGSDSNQTFFGFESYSSDTKIGGSKDGQSL